MPGPAVYVVAAVAVVGVVAAGFAFKEFVYDPHIAPQIQAWNEIRAEQRRRNRARRQGPIAVPAMSETSPANLARTGSDHGSDHDDHEGVSVELEDLVTKEVAEWKTTGLPGTSKLHQRKVRTHDVLDESNIFLPFDPISPTQMTASSSLTASPAPGPSRAISSPPIIHSPIPRTPASFNVNITPESPYVSPPADAPHPAGGLVSAKGPLSPSAASSRTASTSPANTELAHSASSSSSFTPAVIGPRSPSSTHSGYGTANSSVFDDVVSLPSSGSGSRVTSPFIDITAHTPVIVAAEAGNISAPRSAVGSPFTDVHSVSASPYLGVRSPSPPIFVSPGAQSSLHLGAESDIAAISPSMRSEIFSPSFSVDDPFEDASVDGSDVSSWASVGRRTPEH